MRKQLKFAMAGALVFMLWTSPALACTTIIVTKGASSDGSMFVTHSDDNDLMDQRIVYVPAMDHPKGAMRPVYYTAASIGEIAAFNAFSYPRIVAADRGPAYDTAGKPSIPLGYIPQVAHTYAYFDGNYGIMNEHQLMFGECTDGAKITAEPKPGARIFYSAELARVALERCTTAREAVVLMGSLIEEYGYYGTGETLPVADPDEAWVMEMAPSPEGTGGLWVAKRIPDGEVFVAANQFRIRDIDPADPDLLFGKDLFAIAEKHGWWSPDDGTLDWLPTVSLGEYNHPYYSLRRVWRVLSLVAPSKNYSPWVESGLTRYYPFSVRPDKKLAIRDVMRLHRDHYEGTEFDLTKGSAAGPFGYPDRYYGPYDGQGDVGDPSRKLAGAWERPLSVTYCGYTYVLQGRNWLPDAVGGIMWMGLDKPSDTVFMPFYTGVDSLPKSIATYDPLKFDRSSAWWTFNFVSNYQALRYDAMHTELVAKQAELENGFLARQAAVEAEALKLHAKSPGLAKRYLTDYAAKTTAATIDAWWKLSDHFIVKYNDGLLSEPGKVGQPLGYPVDWLQSTSWPDGPTKYEKP